MSIENLVAWKHSRFWTLTLYSAVIRCYQEIIGVANVNVTVLWHDADSHISFTQH